MSLNLSRQKNEFVVKLRRPHPKQNIFIKDKAKRTVIRAGRRGGKTVGVATKAQKTFMQGLRVLYAAPTSDQVERFWAECVNAFSIPIDAGVLYKNESKHIIEIPRTEIRIRAKTAWNADSLRGDYADLLILDEWQLMNEDAWELVGVPMLLDNNGDAIFIYTPPSLRSRSVTKANDPRHAAKLFKKAKLDKTGRWSTHHFSSHDNPFLSKVALSEISQDMTSVAYRQEIEAEDVDEAPGALWKVSEIEDNRVSISPDLERIVVAVDPSANVGESHLDDAGILVAGRSQERHGYVLGDYTMSGTPAKWAQKSVEEYYHWKADCIVAEKNQGGEMVRTVIHGIDKNVPVRLVHATRGKYVRAEPVSVRAERGEIHHVGNFEKLEDELTMWAQGDKSPNRLDAYVWAMTDLILKGGPLEMFFGNEESLNEESLNEESSQNGNQYVDSSISDEIRSKGLYFPA